MLIIFSTKEGPWVRNDFLEKVSFFSAFSCYGNLDFDLNIKQIESKLGIKLSVKKFLLDNIWTLDENFIVSVAHILN